MNNYTNNRIAVTLPSISLPTNTLPRTYLPRLKLPRLPALSYGTTEVRRHVKDLGDLILGNPISGTKQLRDTLLDANMSEFLYTPILNRIVGAGLMLKERTLDPIIQGKPGVALVNALETLGNTADLLSNPIKSLMPWAGGGTTDDFFKSMGWLEGSYREQYQWNTGNKLIDIIGEIVSDPVTWLTFGTSAAAKSYEPGITTLLQQEATEQLTKKFGADVLKDKLIQQYIKDLSAKSIRNITDDLTKQLIKKYGPDILSDTTIRLFLNSYGVDALNVVTKDLTKENSFIVRRIIERIQDQAKYYTTQLEGLAVGTAKYKEVQTLLNSYNTALKNLDKTAIDLTVLRQSDLYAKYLKIRTVGSYVKQLENKYILNPGRWLTGIGEAAYTFKKFYKSNAYNVLRTNMLAKLRKVDLQEFVGNPAEVTRRINREVVAHNAAMYKDTYKSLKDRLMFFTHNEAATNMIITDMQQLANEVFSDPQYADKTLRQLNFIYMAKAVRQTPVLAFIFSRANGTNFEQLFHINPDWRSIDLDTFLEEMEAIDETNVFKEALKGNQKAFDQVYKENKELFEAVHALAAVTEESTAAVTNAYIKAATDILNERFNATSNIKDINEFTGLEQIRVLFGDILPQVAQAIGYEATKNKPILSIDFLTALRNKDEMLFLRLNALLNYLGITQESIPALNDVIKRYSRLKAATNTQRNIFSKELRKEYKLFNSAITYALKKGYPVPDNILDAYKNKQLKEYVDRYIVSLLDKSTKEYKTFVDDLQILDYPRGGFVSLANQLKDLQEFELKVRKQTAVINNFTKDLISKNVLDKPYTVPNAILKGKKDLPYLGQTILKRYELDEQTFLSKVEQIAKDYHKKIKTTSTDFVDDILELQKQYNLELKGNKPNENLLTIMDTLDDLLPVNDYEQPPSETLKRIFQITDKLKQTPWDLEQYRNELDELELILKKWKSSLEHSRKISGDLVNITEAKHLISETTELPSITDIKNNTPKLREYVKEQKQRLASGKPKVHTNTVPILINTNEDIQKVETTLKELCSEYGKDYVILNEPVDEIIKIHDAYNQLDDSYISLYNAQRFDEIPDTAWNRVPAEYRTVKKYDIDIYRPLTPKELEALQKTTGASSLKNSLPTITGDTVLDFVRDLSTNLNTHKQKFIDVFDPHSAPSVWEPLEKTYTMLTSKVEQANLIQKSIQTTFIDNPEFLKEVSDPNSILRTNLNYVINTLRSSKINEAVPLANNMKKVLAKIDAQIAMFTFLDTDFTDIFEMPTEFNMVLQGYLLGTLLSPKYAGINIKNVSDKVIDELVDEFKMNYAWSLHDRYRHSPTAKKFSDLIKAEFKDTRILENIDDLRDAYIAKQELDRLKNKASDLLTDLDYDRIDELELIYDSYRSKYSDQLLDSYNKFTTADLATHFSLATIDASVEAMGNVVKTKLINYRDSIANIAKSIGADNLKLFNLLEDTDAKLMNQLGQDHDLIEAIIKEQIPNNHQVLLETNKFLLHTAGSGMVADLENASKELLEVLHINDLEKRSTMELVNKLNSTDLNELTIAETINKSKQDIINSAILGAHEGSLNYAIYDACRQIGAVGNEFRGAEQILAKVYGKNKAKKYMNILNIMYQGNALQLIQDNTIYESIYEFNAATPYAFKKINFRLLNINIPDETHNLRPTNNLITFQAPYEESTRFAWGLNPNIQVNDELVTTKLQFFMADNLTNIYKNRLGLDIDNIMYEETYGEFNKRFLEPNYRTVLENSLQNYYATAKNLGVTIKDPYDFFYKMSDAELLTWHRWTKSLYFNYNTTYMNLVATTRAALKDAAHEIREIPNRLKNLEYIDTMESKNKEKLTDMYQEFMEEVATEDAASDIIAEVERLENSKIQPDPTDYDSLINKPREQLMNQLNYIIDSQCASIKRPLKEISSLQEAHNTGHAVAEYIKEDATAMERNKLYGDMIADSRTVKEAYPNMSKEDIDILKSYNINYENTQMGDDVVQKLAKHNLDHLKYKSVMQFTPQQLRAYIDHNTDGHMYFVDPSNTFLKNFTPEELDAAGIMYKELKHKNSGIYIIRRTSQDMHDANLSFEIPKEQMPVLQDIYDAILANMNENQKYFHRDNMYAPMELFDGDMLSRQTLNMLDKLDEVQEFLGDLEVQKTYRKIDDLGQNLFHAKNIDRPNWTILGYEDPLNYILNNYVDDLQTNNHYKYAFTPTRLDKLAWQGSTRAINVWNTEHKYLQLFFDNDDVSLDGPVFKQILMNATDEELEWFFDRNHWDACILRQNSKGQPTVYRISIHNHKQLLAAMEAGASCLSHEAYRNVALCVNNHKITSKFINAYQTVIAATFKTLYLTNLGFFVRNFMDSNIYKDLNSSDGFLSVIDNFKYQIQARKMLDKYDELVRKATKNGVLNQDVIRDLLKEVSEEERKIYMFMDLYMNTGAGGGQIRSLQQFLLNYNKKHGDITPTYQWAEWYRETVLGNKLIAGLNYINNDIEQTARLALFLNMMDNGEDYYNAIKKVIDTHFDYELKSPGLALFDQLCWFSTFPINNFFYYANEGMTKNPELYKLQLDLLQLSWNDGTNYTWDDVRNSKYLTYNALAGNLRFNLFGKNIVLKTGSSLMDFMNIALNPVEELGERLNPFISTLVGIDDVSELNPLKAPINRAKQIYKGQSYLPSVYATLYPKYERRKYIKRKYYNKRSYATSKFKISKKPIKIYPDSFISKQMRRRLQHFYTNRYYTKRWNPNITRHLTSEPVYMPESESRTARAYARYTRQMKTFIQNKKRH